MSVATIRISGELWREMGEKFDAPLPLDYEVRQTTHHPEQDEVWLSVAIPREVATEICPIYQRGADGEPVLIGVQGDPQWPTSP